MVGRIVLGGAQPPGFAGGTAISAKSGRLNSDILIIGGGLVGGTLACALAGAGLSVTVVDAGDPTAGLDAAFDGRASAIALASQRALDGIGLWPLMADQTAPIEDIRVSDGQSLYFLHYDHRDTGDEPFGFMVENRTTRQALYHRMQALDRLHLLAPARLLSLDRSQSGVTAEISNGETITARLVVGADGRGSQVREEAAIGLMKWSYRQTGIVCTVEHEKPHLNIAHERFLPGGPFAILPLRGNRSSIVWTEREDLAAAIMALDEAEFLAELGRRFGDFLGAIDLAGGRWAYPLTLQQAETAVCRRLALVGDADHGMHPIAGQGLNMGLRDVAALAEVLIDAHRLGLDLGSAVVLNKYSRWRRFDNTLMLALTDGLNRLFSNNIRPISLARDLGLAAVNRLPPLKKLFMRHAMGLAGELPRLMQGRQL